MEGSYTVLVMNLMLDARVEDDTAVVTCRGHIVYGATARRFRACIARLLQRYRRVVLDLGAVTHLDARGVGMLAVLIARARSTDRGLTLSTSSDRVERVLRLSGLDVELHNDRDSGTGPPVGLRPLRTIGSRSKPQLAPRGISVTPETAGEGATAIEGGTMTACDAVDRLRADRASPRSVQSF
jgi:anti-anti-sigma factor